jgi:tRNA (guanine37-N1)-methyltransferase
MTGAESRRGIAVLTAFPTMFAAPLEEGMIRIARETGRLVTRVIDYRTFTSDRHRTIDDAPFGGGAGMILKPEPIARALEAADTELGGRAVRVLLSPQGERLDQRMAHELAETKRLTLVCGRYKDVDDRARGWIDREISIGDYVLSGGELAAMVVIDVVARLLPGVVGDAESVETDSFETGILDAPYYTRPSSFEGVEVPEVLRSGDHGAIARWRRKEALRRTLVWRPDLLERASLSPEDETMLREIESELSALVRHLTADT